MNSKRGKVTNKLIYILLVGSLIVPILLLFTKTQPARAQASWYDTAWQYRRQISSNNLQIPADMPDGGETGFPIDLIIDPVNGINDPTGDMATTLFDNIQTNGEDILITDSDGTTKLAHGIKRLVTTDGSEYLALAFLAPSISSSQATDFYLYYDNATCIDQQQKDAVYPVADSWQAYWPLEAQNSGAAAGAAIYEDWTTNTNTGDDYVSNTNKGGQIGQGQQFDGSNDYILVTHSPSLNFGSADSYTISFWTRSDAYAAFDNFMGKWSGVGGYPYSFGTDANKFPGFAIYDGAVGASATGTAINNTLWHYIVGVKDVLTDKVYIYIDGLEKQNNPDNTTAEIANATDINLGARSGGGLSLLGVMDEISFSEKRRSPDWILAIFNCQDDNDTFWTMGSEEDAPENGNGNGNGNGTNGTIHEGELPETGPTQTLLAFLGLAIIPILSFHLGFLIAKRNKQQENFYEK